jgi:cytochrome P450 family 3 subfamily A
MIDHEEDISLVDDEMKSNEKNNSGSSGSWNNKALRKTLTNNEIMAMAIQFLLAGYETTATTLEFITYSLATNQTCQDKLIEEIDRVLDQHVNHIYIRF